MQLPGRRSRRACAPCRRASPRACSWRYRNPRPSRNPFWPPPSAPGLPEPPEHRVGDRRDIRLVRRDLPAADDRRAPVGMRSDDHHVLAREPEFLLDPATHFRHVLAADAQGVEGRQREPISPVLGDEDLGLERVGNLSSDVMCEVADLRGTHGGVMSTSEKPARILRPFLSESLFCATGATPDGDDSNVPTFHKAQRRFPSTLARAEALAYKIPGSVPLQASS